MKEVINFSVEHRFQDHSAPVYALEIDADGIRIYSGAGDRFVASWNILQHNPEKFAIKADSAVYSIRLIQEKNWILLGLASGDIHVIDLDKKEEVRHIQLHKKGLFHFLYSAKNKMLYTGDGIGQIGVWNIDDLSLVRITTLGNFKIRNIITSPSEEELIVATGDGKIRILETEWLNEKHTLSHDEKSVNALLYNEKSNTLISGGWDGHIYEWDCQNQYQLIQKIPAHNYAIYDFTPILNGEYIASCSRDKSIKIWQSNSLDFIQKLDFQTNKGHRNSVNKIVWSPQHNKLISTGDDRQILIWKLN